METPSPSTVTLFPLRTAFRPSDKERFCRLCMDNPHATKLQRLFDDEKPVNPDLLKEIWHLVNVKIVFPDDRHSVICSRCLRKLEDYFIFRNHCHAVDIGVREMRAKNLSDLPMTPEVRSPSQPSSSPSERRDEECQVVESVPPEEDSLGIFDSMMFCQNSADGPNVYRVVMERFVYRPLSLFDWICEVESCGCRLDVEKDLSCCQAKAEHGHELDEHDKREFCKINPAIRTFLNTLPKEWTKTDLPISTVDEIVLNIETYQQDNELERLSELSFLNVDNPEVTFFTCVQRGLSLVHGGYNYLLSLVRFEGGSCMWKCPWRECNALLETNSELTTFKPLYEHAHAPPNPSVLNEITGTPISHDQAFDELASCPASNGQVARPEVTFYRPTNSVIRVLYGGYCFELDEFLAGSKTRWDCTWHGCSAQLELNETLHCRLVPAGVSSHGHPQPDGPVCSAVNIISPVKAMVELNGKRSLMEDQQQQQRNVSNILDEMPQLQVQLNRAKLSPDLANQMARYCSTPKKSFYRYRRTLIVELDGHYYRLVKRANNTTSWWRCVQCSVRIILNRKLALTSTDPKSHDRHTPIRLLKEMKSISKEKVQEELRNHSLLLN